MKDKSCGDGGDYSACSGLGNRFLGYNNQNIEYKIQRPEEYKKKGKIQ